MPTPTPKLGIQKPLGNETVSRAAFNQNWDIIDAAAQKNITQGATAPASPVDGDLWIDTSVSPNVLKRYSAGAWVQVGIASAADINAARTDQANTFTDNQTAPQWVSNAPQGTPPLQVASSTMVANLNSEMVGGKRASDLALASDLSAHAANDILHVPYAAATGSANAYAVTLIPAPSAYAEGFAVAIKIPVDNTGPSTINVNGLGAIPIKKPNGNDVSAGNLKAGSIYTLRYNGTNFILQGEGGGGTAQPGDVLSGKTFTNDAGEQTGTMPNNGAVTITPGTSNITIPAGYHNGSGYVAGDPDLIPANIKSGVSIFGVVGSLVLNPVNGTQQWTTPGSYSWTVPDGVYRIMIAFVGGGGGGAGTTYNNNKVGGGGGGGGIIFADVTPGQVINFTVGAGGAGAPAGNLHGGAGTNTTILGFTGGGGSGGDANSGSTTGGTASAPSSFSGYYFIGSGGGGYWLNQSLYAYVGALSPYTGSVQNYSGGYGGGGASPIAGAMGSSEVGTIKAGNGGIGSGGGGGYTMAGGNGGNGAVQIWW